MGMLISGVASASFTGNSGSLSISSVITGLTGIFAKLDVENTFDEGQLINKSGTTTPNERRGVNVTHNQVSSYCLSNSDGATKDYCLSSKDSLIVLEGSTGGDLYGTASAASAFLVGDSIQSRLWLAPNGVSMFSTANNTPPSPAMPSGIMVGSNAQNAATFLVDATNDWTKHLPIAAPAASECDAADEKGRMYFDSTANAFKYCNGTAWSDFGGGGGGGYDSISYSQFANNADTASIYEDSNIRLGWDDDPGGNNLQLTLLTNSGGSGGVTAICRIVPGTYVVSGRYEITALNTASNIALDIANKGSVNCMIAARDDDTYPFYEVGIVNTEQPTNKNSIKVEKLVP